ncbi:hypothetical protein ASPWEDRAFT_35864 [Aspergillus wentii DTO 134E9]|uniref:MYND-type domain-containing protein n=1 Tax=Aspergillus wentii DTO 134E9 TaxID=1073089 RepID=A0A1L9RTJ9_ASPWE|nr:uncharacterized protein ASPWEDRAFT_35864 [Aspergillus wentii DTO 134E9]OJJ38245.1 hypothetical protein ASPWEDRAFT_35864 [Aspergillus wentii DTO 134E9]
MKVGYTIAILYADQHAFIDGSTGVRQESNNTVKVRTHGLLQYPKEAELRNVQVFPSTLDNLLKLNHEVHLWKAFPNKGVCHACNKEKEPLQKCARCGMVSYCDQVSGRGHNGCSGCVLRLIIMQECQKSGWEKMNHKKNYKILRDNDFQGMLKVRWEPVIEDLNFPLNIG